MTERPTVMAQCAADSDTCSYPWARLRAGRPPPAAGRRAACQCGALTASAQCLEGALDVSKLMSHCQWAENCHTVTVAAASSHELEYHIQIMTQAR